MKTGVKRTFVAVMALSGAVVVPCALGQAGGTVVVGQGPPAVVLGQRVRAQLERVQVADAVVVARDADAYVRAISGWTPSAAYPVLLDDGTVMARQNIGRFVRAFAPARVYRLEGEGALAFGEVVEARGGSAVASAWGVDGVEELRSAWELRGHTPAGLVVTSRRDPAWTAAVALAAGRGQPLLWLDQRSQNPGVPMGWEAAETFARTVAEGAAQTGYGWEDLGDALDAVTLCLNMHLLAKHPSEGDLALTDVVGRRNGPVRWAWAGAVVGDEASAAYAAMCALFLDTRHAWMFDGYPAGQAGPYAIDGVGPMLERLQIAGRVFTSPNTGLRLWRDLGRGGIEGGLVHVNTKGHMNWFDLTPGQARGTDVPFTRYPSAVHFIHSFSAQRMGIRSSIASRWLEQGAFAYYGSVSEPFLTAFHPASGVVGRLGAGAPWGAAVRQDSGKVWKLNVIGDPLWLLRQRDGVRGEGELGIEGVEDVEASMRRSLTERDFAGALEALVLLARDEDAQRLVRSVLADRPGEVDARFAQAGLPVAFFAKDVESFEELYQRLGAEAQTDLYNTTMLWQLLRGELEGEARERTVNLLRLGVRADSVVDDARALRPHVQRLYGVGGVDAMRDRLLGLAPNDAVRNQLREALR